MGIPGVAEDWDEIEPGTFVPYPTHHGGRPGTTHTLCGLPADGLHPMPGSWGLSEFPGVTDRDCRECLQALLSEERRELERERQTSRPLAPRQGVPHHLPDITTGEESQVVDEDVKRS